MGKINWARVLLGGVLWFIVFNVLWSAAWILYLGKDVLAAFRALNRPFELTAWVAFGLAVTLVVGIFSIWFYAAIRPRYGLGPKTAARAGLAVWLAVNLVPTLWWGWLVQLPTRLVALDVVTNLVAIVAATLAGAWLYKE